MENQTAQKKTHTGLMIGIVVGVLALSVVLITGILLIVIIIFFTTTKTDNSIESEEEYEIEFESNNLDKLSLDEDLESELKESEITDDKFAEIDSEESIMVEENIEELPATDNSVDMVNKYNIEVWDEAMVNDVQNQICEHYQNLYTPPGNYAIFDETDITTEDAYKFTMVLRYQMSDAEAEEIITSGGMPQANILVTYVYIDKQTGKVTDDLGNETWILD